VWCQTWRAAGQSGLFVSGFVAIGTYARLKLYRFSIADFAALFHL